MKGWGEVSLQIAQILNPVFGLGAPSYELLISWLYINRKYKNLIFEEIAYLFVIQSVEINCHS